MGLILVIEDKDSMARMLRQAIEAEGHETIIAPDGITGIRMIRDNSPDLVLTDLKLPGKDGSEVLMASKEDNPLRPVIIMTAHGSVETAVLSIKNGAYDFITKPFDIDHLLMLIKRALDNQKLMRENLLLKAEFSSSLGLPNIIGKSEAILSTSREIQKVAPAKTTVLLLGESGTGKELFARAIHHLSGRAGYPFVPINCAAIPATLLESELFGYEKGAFSGAEHLKLGKFELANKGTIFLDEIGEMELAVQAKLLRVLQEGEIERVGGAKPIKIDIRIIAASNKNIERAVSQGAFREDLFYRLSVFPITIPPLRDRAEDIPMLVDHFIARFSSELKSGVNRIAEDALKILMNAAWKGNVRELENTIERAVILCEGNVLTQEHIPCMLLKDKTHGNGSLKFGSLEDASRDASRKVEIELIRNALESAGGNKTKAAEHLRISYKTLFNKIKDYKIS